MADERRIKRLDAALILLIAASGLAYYLSYYNYGLNFLDEGYLVDPVMRVAGGELPYRDFHHFYAPGRFYLFALIFKITGPDLLAVRLTFAIMHAVSGALAYLLVRNISSPLYAFVAAAIIIAAPGAWHKSFFTVLPVLVIFLAFVYIDRPGAIRAIVLGFAAAATFVFRQDVGIYAVASFVALYLWSRFAVKDNVQLRDAAWFASGMLVVLVPFAVFFATQDALSHMLVELFVSGHKGTSANSLPFPPLFPIWGDTFCETLFAKVFYLPFAVYAAALVVLFSGRRDWCKDPGNRKLFFLSAMGLLVTIQVKNRSDMSHLWQVMPPVVMTAAALLFRFDAFLRRHGMSSAVAFPYLSLALLSGWILHVALTQPTSGSAAMRRGGTTLINVPRAKVYVPYDTALVLEQTLDYIRDNIKGPDGADRFLAVPDVPMFYFLVGTTAPVKYELFRLGMSSSEKSQVETIRELEEKRINWVVLNMNEVDDGKTERKFSVHSALLYSYIHEAFRPVKNIGTYLILTRKTATDARRSPLLCIR